MNRRNFLAYIPALGAAPFISSELLKTDDKIEVIKPKIIESTKEIFEFDISKVKIMLVQDDVILGEGVLTNANIEHGWDGRGPASMEVEGRMTGFF